MDLSRALGSKVKGRYHTSKIGDQISSILKILAESNLTFRTESL